MRFKEAHDWQITYLGESHTKRGAQVRDLFAPPPITVVSFRAPDQMEVRTEGERSFIAVADTKSAGYFFPGDGFGMWVPKGGMPTFVSILALNLDGPAYPLRTDWKDIGERDPVRNYQRSLMQWSPGGSASGSVLE